MIIKFKDFLNENINFNEDDIVRSMAWLEMLLIYDDEYHGGLSEKSWKDDNRMGILFQESMKYLVGRGLSKIVENDTDNVRLNFLKWKITENGINELYKFFKVPKTRDEYLFMDNEWLKKYDTKDYKISGIPDSLFERRFQQETRKNITYNSWVDYYKIKDWWEGHQRGTKGWWTGLNKYLGLTGDLLPNVDEITLYRGINLKCGGPHGTDYTNGEICTKIRNGEIKIGDKITCGKSSWTLLPSVAKSFASGKNGLSDSRDMKPNEVGIILKNTFYSSEMLLDTNWVENHKYLNGGQLFSSEFEVIVKPKNRKIEIVEIFYAPKI